MIFWIKMMYYMSSIWTGDIPYPSFNPMSGRLCSLPHFDSGLNTIFLPLIPW